MNIFLRIDEQCATKKNSSKKEDIESLLAAISGSNDSQRRMDNQRVSLSELQDQTRAQKVNQSQSDSNLQKLSKEKEKKRKKKKVKKLFLRIL